MMQSSVLRRIMRDLRGLQENPLDNIRVSINEDDVLQFQGILAGPGTRVFPGGGHVCASSRQTFYNSGMNAVC